MSSDDIRLSVEVDTKGAVKDLDKVGDASRDAGEALEALDRKADAIDPTVTIDIDLDESRARAASTALDDIDRKGRGMADGVGFGNNALRDLTGPLGDSVGPAGDLGDAFEGLGDIVGGIAGKLGLGAEAVGKLTGAVAGVGVVVAAGVAAWSLYQKSQEKAKKAAEELLEAQELLAEGKAAEAASNIAESYRDTIEAVKRAGFAVDDFGRTLNGSDVLIDTVRARMRELDAALLAGKGSFEELDAAFAERTGLQKLLPELEAAQAGWDTNVLNMQNNAENAAELEKYFNSTATQAAAMKETTVEAFDGITKAFDDLARALDEADAIENVRDAFDNIEAAALEAWETAKAGAPEAEGAMRNYEQAIRDALRQVGGLQTEIDDIPPETVARIFAEVQQGDLDEAKRILGEVEENIDPIKLTIDLEDLEKQAFVAAARARNAGSSGGSGGTYTPPGPGQVGYSGRENFATVNNYYPPAVTPLQVQTAQRTFTRVQGR